jgi:hypothetical protein
MKVRAGAAATNYQIVLRKGGGSKATAFFILESLLGGVEDQQAD